MWASCAACAEYLSASRRAIAGLKGFSFEAGPGLNARVVAALRARAEADGGAAGECAAMGGAERRGGGADACWGSVVDLRVGPLGGGAVGPAGGEVRQGLMALWILPSFGLLLLFPLLPLLAAKRSREGRTI